MIDTLLEVSQATSSTRGVNCRSSVRKNLIGAPQGWMSIRQRMVFHPAAPRNLRSVSWGGKSIAAVLLMLVSAFAAPSALAQSAIPLQVVLETGNADFPEACTLSITLTLTDGTVSFPAPIVRGREGDSPSVTVGMAAIRFPTSPGRVTAALVRDFTLTFTAEKLPNMPFDENASWALDSISMGLMPDPRAQLVYNSTFDSSRSFGIGAGAGKLSGGLRHVTGRTPYIEGPIPVNAVATESSDLTTTRTSRNQIY